MKPRIELTPIKNKTFFKASALDLAKKLLGLVIVRCCPGNTTYCQIVETEAYHEKDPASHSFRGRTRRNSSMFLEGGHLYVYKIYGVHHCVNIVANALGVGEAVLIRSVFDLEKNVLIKGPGRVCAELKLDLNYDGRSLLNGTDEIFLAKLRGYRQAEILSSTRIGITKGLELEYRFFLGAFAKHLPKPKQAF
ncbi:MAG: DNA-3-methyladenine glycosylase [Deltaproteobacteria bacterium]|nr:DNA-3-methyladenine glycosylase [Deltaproteobacteria bacterium]